MLCIRICSLEHSTRYCTVLCTLINFRRRRAKNSFAHHPDRPGRLTSAIMMPGALTLKGGISLKKAKKNKMAKKKSKKKKKKKDKDKSESSKDGADEDAAAAAGSMVSDGKRELDQDDGAVARKRRKSSNGESSEDAPPAAATSGKKRDTRTAAEKAMDRAREDREEQRMRKSASLSYREKVDKFNNYLESLSEHHDVPKVGNAGMG